MKNFIAKFSRNKLAVGGAFILCVIVILSVLTPLLNLQPPNEVNTGNRFLRPFTAEHLLGADHLGRDLLSRLLWGTRLSLIVGVIAALIAAVLGSAIGIAAGFYGGRADNFLMRLIDILMAFPYVLLALAIVAVLGPSLMNALIAVAIVNIPFFARNVRGVTLTLANSDFIAAAKLSGRNTLGILILELLPNLAPVITVAFSTTVGWMILETAGLSFLGLGSQPPQSDLGSMLGEGRSALIVHPHTSIIPGVMIFVIVLGTNLFGDGVRDALDPRLSKGNLTRSVPMTVITRDKIPSKKGTALIEINSLRTVFQLDKRDYSAVKDVNLQLSKGECMGLVGESGSGKSVTALSLLGLVPSPPASISSGSVWLNEQEILGLGYADIRKIRGNKVSYIFQDPLTSLHPLKTIGQQLFEAISTHQSLTKSLIQSKCYELLIEVKLNPVKRIMSSYPYQLSGGMRQRVGIAMALANDPELLIADEPTTALEVTVQAQILSILKLLCQKRGLSLLFISHDLAVISQITDKLAVMYAGEIIEEGLTKNVLETPLHPYTEALMNCSPNMNLSLGDKLPAPIPGQPPDLQTSTIGCAFGPRCKYFGDECKKEKIPLNVSSGRAVRCIKLGVTNG